MQQARADTYHVYEGESIQAAIIAAYHGDEVIVHPGTYYESITFFGRRIWVHSTDGPEATIIDASGLGNSVVKAIYFEGPEAILEGFTLTGGEGSPDEYNRIRGGGMRNHESSPTVKNCVFTGNTASYGGGMHNDRSNATIIDCKFIANTAVGAGGMGNSDGAVTVIGCEFIDNLAAEASGGAMANSHGEPHIVGCTFENNLSADDGGAIENWYADAVIEGCTFQRNSSMDLGGAISDYECGPTITRCVFRDNRSLSYYGGAISQEYWDQEDDSIVSNCRFLGNSAEGGGAICLFNAGGMDVVNCELSNNAAWGGGAILLDGNAEAYIRNCTFNGNVAVEGAAVSTVVSFTTITNSVVWGNLPEPFEGHPTVSYSCVDGGADGVGNIDRNPLFVDPQNGDFRLLPGSPCIDAGFNNSLPRDLQDLDTDELTCERIPLDLDGNPRFADDPYTADTGCGLSVVVDMGAYEYAGSAAEVVFGDVDGNGTVDMDDVFAVLAAWGEYEGCLLGDVNGNGIVDIYDIFAILDNWGPCP